MGGEDGIYNLSIPAGPPLYITKEEAESLIKEYGSPLYFYDVDQVLEHLDRLQSQIPYATSRILYAMKANFNPHLLAQLQKKGVGVEAISVTEIHLALEIGFSKDKILFTSNGLTDEEMHAVHDLGVLINIDSVFRLEQYGQCYPGTKVSVRFNPGVTAGEFKEIQTARDDCKFGIKITKLPLVLELAKKYDLKIVGIHQHAGSGIQLSSEFLESANHVLDIATKEDFPHLEFIDLGGGLKARYKPNDREPDLLKLFSLFADRFTAISKSFGRDIQLVIEPGKFIVAESGHLLIKVVEIKDEIYTDLTLVSTDSSFSHLIRPVMYGAYHHIVNLSNPDGPLKRYQVVGNICESGDIFTHDRELPTLRVGDILCILTAGAYGYSMASVYNLRALPAEIVRVNGKIFCGRKRLQPSELSRMILDESNFKK